MRKWLLGLVLLSLGWASAPPGTAAEPPRELDCREVPGAAALFERARILLVGELHGTAESPAFTAALVCRALRAGRSVTVGLEWVASEEQRVAAYLDSDGGPDARQALLAGAIWQARGQAQYGATSEAMLGLLENLRRLRRDGHPVAVILFNRYGRGSQDRDRLMAQALGDLIESSSSDLFVVLTGNIHSRLKTGTRWDPSYEPMAYLVHQAHPDWPMVTLDVAHAGGTAWLCVSGEPCGARLQRPRGQAAELFAVTLHDQVQEHGHHGEYYVGEIHASPPAVASAP